MDGDQARRDSGGDDIASYWASFARGGDGAHGVNRETAAPPNSAPSAPSVPPAPPQAAGPSYSAPPVPSVPHQAAAPPISPPAPGVPLIPKSTLPPPGRPGVPSGRAIVPPPPPPGPSRPATGRARVITRPLSDLPAYPVTRPVLPAAEGGLYGGEPEQRRRMARHRAIRKRKHMPLWQELPLLLVVAFGLAVLIRTFLLQAFYIPSGSMEHTLDIGDKVVVNKIIYDVRDPQRGEVIVFRGTDKWAPEHEEPADTGFFGAVGQFFGDLIGLSPPGEKDFIKRVVGLPGDTVSCCDPQGRLYVNGVAIDEPYIYDNSPLDAPPSGEECTGRSFDPVVVPAGQVFVMGDHRGVSQDSRCQGPVPIENIIGRAFLVVWPASRLSTLPAAKSFDKVPDATALPSGPGPPGPLLPATGIVVAAHCWFRSRRAARSASLFARARRRLSA